MPRLSPLAGSSAPRGHCPANRSRAGVLHCDGSDQHPLQNLTFQKELSDLHHPHPRPSPGRSLHSGRFPSLPTPLPSHTVPLQSPPVYPLATPGRCLGFPSISLRPRPRACGGDREGRTEAGARVHTLSVTDPAQPRGPAHPPRACWRAVLALPGLGRWGWLSCPEGAW